MQNVTILIPGMVPPSLNQLRRKYRNPHVYAKLRENWKLAIFVVTPWADRKLLDDWSKSKVQLQMTIWNSREYDPDNLAGSQKPILDALKLLGMIHDDSPQWLQLLPPKCNRGPRKYTKTEISISPAQVS